MQGLENLQVVELSSLESCFTRICFSTHAQERVYLPPPLILLQRGGVGYGQSPPPHCPSKSTYACSHLSNFSFNQQQHRQIFSLNSYSIFKDKGTYPKKILNCQLPKGIFPSGNVQFSKQQIPKSSLAASLGYACSSRCARPPQIPKSSLAASLGYACSSRCARPPQPNLAAVLGPLWSLRRLRGPNLTFGTVPLWKLHIWEVANWEIVTWEVALGKSPVGKCLWEST